MVALPGYITKQHLDEDSDSAFQARAELSAAVTAINLILEYLNTLFGWDGTKATAISTLFSNQAVIFPAGTRVFFYQQTPPPGWVQFQFDVGRYLMAVPGDSGGNPIGNYAHFLPTTGSALSVLQLPSFWLSGSTGFEGNHAHTYTRTDVNYSSGSVSFERDANGPKAFALYSSVGTSSAGVHSHSFSVHSGGAGHTHEHYVDMSAYRPSGLMGIIGIKS